MGFSPEYNKINPSKILQGRYINEMDIIERRKVCVIGEKILNDLYLPNENAVGSLILINGVYYKVVGVVQPYSQNFNIFGNAAEMIVLPFSTMQLAMNMGKDIHCIAITADNRENIADYENSIKILLKERNTISPSDTGGVEAFNLQVFIKPFMMLLFGVNALMWFVGLGTLLAGAIGVSNIMLITVRERTQEIGVMRALGATPAKIITQIMSESVVLTALAGVIGIVCGVGLLSVIGNLVEMENLQISFSIAILALCILIVCGLFAGLLPSSRALKIKAIDALRDE
jgi:putative ABC transport system permease protein